LSADVATPKIMIVGDSISAGPGCYKKYLLQQLTTHGYTDFSFVGEYTDDCGSTVRHSAVSCTTSGNYTQETFTVPNCFPDQQFPGMSTLVATHDPDLILIQLGVNDVWSGNAAIQPILDNYTELVEQARAQNPNVVIVVAQIHKIITNDCANDASTANAERLVEAVPGWAEGITTAEAPVFVADLWTNSDPTEADDCVHPNTAGALRMAENWYEALKDILPKG
jgi:lysophospholipase L1-like esterase